MDISVKALEEAVSIRRQIDNLERRLSSILGGAPARPVAAALPYAGSGVTFRPRPERSFQPQLGPVGRN